MNFVIAVFLRNNIKLTKNKAQNIIKCVRLLLTPRHFPFSLLLTLYSSSKARMNVDHVTHKS